MKRIAYSVMLVALAAGLVACRQGINDRCQVNSDCEDGLICVYPPGGTPQTGGTCQMPSSNTDMAGVDQAAIDATVTDAGTVDATGADATATDATATDAASDLTGVDGTVADDMTGQDA